jgi:multiple sugar transport system substrate-binding protein
VLAAPLALASALPARRAAAAPQRLTVAAFPAVDEMLRAAIPAWRDRNPGCEVQVVSRQFVDHHTAMTAALSTASRLPDLMALEVGYVGRFARGAGLEDLRRPPFSVGELAGGYVSYAYQQAIAASGAVVAVPLDIGPGTLLYRDDLLRKAGLGEQALTRSWDSFIDAGERLRASSGAYLVAHAREVKDILIRTGIAPGDGLYFDAGSRVRVDSPAFRRAFSLAREVRRRRLDGRLSAWSSDWSEAFRRGMLATQMSGAWLAGHLANWLAPTTAGRWRAAELPESVAVAYGGTFLALPRGAAPERKALAWDLARLMSADRGVQIASFRRHDAFPALRAAHDDPFMEQPIDFLGGQRARLLWRDTAQRITAVAVHKQDAFAEEVVNTELDKVLDRGKDIDSALGDAARLLASRAFR